MQALVHWQLQLSAQLTADSATRKLPELKNIPKRTKVCQAGCLRRQQSQFLQIWQRPIRTSHMTSLLWIRSPSQPWF